MQFRVIVVTDPQTNTATNPQTGPITIHCAAASVQYNDDGDNRNSKKCKVLVKSLPPTYQRTTSHQNAC